MFGLTLRGRRKDLERTLRDDPTQPVGWESWLAAATSIDHLHASCPQPGWLVYCAYWAKVPQDKLLDGALALGVLACERHEAGPILPARMRTLRDLDWPDLAALMFDLLQPSATTRLVVDLVPTQENSLLYHLGELMIANREDAEGDDDEDDDDDLDDEDLMATALDDVLDIYGVRSAAGAPGDASLLGPYREDPTALGKDVVAPLVAAGYVLTIETLFHRARGLREALTTRSAAAASLLRPIAPAFHDEALALLRTTYGWT